MALPEPLAGRATLALPEPLAGRATLALRAACRRNGQRKLVMARLWRTNEQAVFPFVLAGHGRELVDCGLAGAEEDLREDYLEHPLLDHELGVRIERCLVFAPMPLTRITVVKGNVRAGERITLGVSRAAAVEVRLIHVVEVRERPAMVAFKGTVASPEARHITSSVAGYVAPSLEWGWFDPLAAVHQS